MGKRAFDQKCNILQKCNIFTFKIINFVNFNKNSESEICVTAQKLVDIQDVTSLGFAHHGKDS